MSIPAAFLASSTISLTLRKHSSKPISCPWGERRKRCKEISSVSQYGQVPSSQGNAAAVHSIWNTLLPKSYPQYHYFFAECLSI